MLVVLGLTQPNTGLCKYMMLASGRASVFLLRATTRNVMKKISGYAPAWDHAVGIICVHDAGGKSD
ncbi:hypothetical protein P3S68_017343 [Capsicum galapagoense]